jgi:short subunit dehydrogenase-like uncharacterized protein
MTNWLLYGAYGYTGKLIVAEAVARGHRPVLAGRDAARVEALARDYDLEWLALDLDYADRLAAVAGRFDLILHAAGPFIHTSQPMLDACLAGKTHYLDITGELSVFNNTFAHHTAAVERGILLMSGVGFDIVPSDCLARYVADQMPGATWLETAISTSLVVSAGTVKTALSGMSGTHSAVVVRRDDQLVPIRYGSGSRTVYFSNGRQATMMPAPWGDLVTAAHTTGIGNITSYLELPAVPGGELATKLGSRLLSIGPVRRAAEVAIERAFPGPDEQTRETARAYCWARAANDQGEGVEAWLETVEIYRFTALAAVSCVERVLAGTFSGALTPASAFGADFVLELEGTRRFDRLPRI